RNASLAVMMEGPALAHDDRERTFESFYHGPAPAEGRVKGSGLRLAIAREYATLHGARIELKERSDGRHGAWFRLSLPLANAPLLSKSAVSKPVTLAGIK